MVTVDLYQGRCNFTLGFCTQFISIGLGVALGIGKCPLVCDVTSDIAMISLLIDFLIHQESQSEMGYNPN